MILNNHMNGFESVSYDIMFCEIVQKKKHEKRLLQSISDTSSNNTASSIMICWLIVLHKIGYGILFWLSSVIKGTAVLFCIIFLFMIPRIALVYLNVQPWKGLVREDPQRLRSMCGCVLWTLLELIYLPKNQKHPFVINEVSIFLFF